jgi:undecaprenyl-diphosphatase
MGSGPLMIKAFGAGPVLWGCLVAAISAGVAVHWLVGYLNKHGLALFAWYRVALAIVVVIFLI